MIMIITMVTKTLIVYRLEVNVSVDRELKKQLLAT